MEQPKLDGLHWWRELRGFPMLGRLDSEFIPDDSDMEDLICCTK